jgi:checkpoint serine/threonine-protein kinase
MFLEHALLYESYALFLFSKGQVLEADKVYKISVSRLAWTENVHFFLADII